jgi:hypothetical protein
MTMNTNFCRTRTMYCRASLCRWPKRRRTDAVASLAYLAIFVNDEMKGLKPHPLRRDRRTCTLWVGYKRNSISPFRESRNFLSLRQMMAGVKDHAIDSHTNSHMRSITKILPSSISHCCMSRKKSAQNWQRLQTYAEVSV